MGKGLANHGRQTTLVLARVVLILSSLFSFCKVHKVDVHSVHHVPQCSESKVE